MGLLDSATTLIGDASKAVAVVSSGIAAIGSLGGIANGITSFVSGVKTIPTQKLPLPNPLHSYATYNYIIGIAVLTDDELNNPDKSYRAGKKLKLIAKSANAAPSNRINTPYGKFDFFIDNLVIHSVVGHQKGNNTNATGITFEITEPYSMGLFTSACQQAAWEAGHKNWREAPFILTVEFRGNKESGSMVPVPHTNRQIPFKWQNISMNVKETGSVYRCEVMPYNQQALTTKNANLRTDTSASGSTVQEILQTGDKSLQVTINKQRQQLKTDGVVAVADEILIIFPTNPASAAQGAAAGKTEDKSGATTGSASPTSDAIYKKLGVARSSNNQTLVQTTADCNELGKSLMDISPTAKGTAPVGKDNQVYSDKAKNWIRGNNTSDPSVTDVTFSQNTDIVNAINQVLLKSKFAVDTLGADRLSTTGWRKWWKVDVQTYNIGTTEDPATGQKAKLIVYRVLPYGTHASTTASPNVKAPGFEELKKQAVKHYNYIYTGKNIDVLKFEINYENSFSTLMAADGLKRNQDVKTAADNGGTKPEKPDPDLKAVPKGNPPAKDANPSTVSYTATNTKTDNLGGTGNDTEGTRAARLFHDAINHGTDMMNLTIEILGDPYWIAQSGTGNYSAAPTQYTYLNADGTVNYQTNEVDVLVNFRTPVDLNQGTGLYNFNKMSKSAPVMEFSGLYRITNITSTFKNNTFTQVLEGPRRNQQESKKPAEPKKTMNSTAKLEVPNNGDGEG